MKRPKPKPKPKRPDEHCPESPRGMITYAQHIGRVDDANLTLCRDMMLQWDRSGFVRVCWACRRITRISRRAVRAANKELEKLA